MTHAPRASASPGPFALQAPIMRFAPRPENDFREYIHTYFRECRARFGRIDAIAGKWMYRDLFPAMSDFDTRFIVGDGMTADDWCQMSTAIGEAHLDLCQRYPAWARNLEHLPGINLTWSELSAGEGYYPEFKHWTFYDTRSPDRLAEALADLGRRPWDSKDELFHLRRFCQYYGRYDRAIDPAVNLGYHTNKYPLHSRLMHYFNPPVLAAVCLLDRCNYAGKMQAFEIASQRFPSLRCWDMVFGILHAQYETPDWYAETHLAELEDALAEALGALADQLRAVITLVPHAAGSDVAAWRLALQQAPVAPSAVIFDSARFARLMKGRLWFYANAPDYFEATWLIQNELRRIGYNFFQLPFRVYWQHRTGQAEADPVRVLKQLRGELLTDAEVDATREFHRLTAAPAPPGQEVPLARALVAVFDDFFRALSKVSLAVRAESAVGAKR